MAGPLLRAKFHPHRCNNKGAGPQKLKFLLGVDQNVEYKRPAGAYPLRNFCKVYRVCTPFHDTLAVKISLDLLKWLWSYGGFKLTGFGYPQIFGAPSGETMRQTPISFRGARTCSRSSITNVFVVSAFNSLQCLDAVGLATGRQGFYNFWKYWKSPGI